MTRSTIAAFARRRPATAIALGLAATAGLAWAIGEIGVRIASVTPNPRALPGPPAVPVTFAATDGSRIAATYWPGRTDDAPAVLIVPGIGSLHRKLAPNAEWLAAQGYGVLAIDLRGHGASSPALHAFGWTESRDVHAALTWLKARQNGAKVALIGISMGGAAALVGPEGPAQPDAFVAQAVFADLRRAVRCRIALFLGPALAWMLEPLLSFQSIPRFGVHPDAIAPLAGMARLACPVLVVGGARDPFVPVAEAFEFTAAARDPRGIWIAPKLGHDAISDTLGDDYRAQVLAFLRETIGTCQPLPRAGV